MPRRNRVDPWGNIVAHPARGMLMGNRGCLHDTSGNIVRSRDRPAWITCVTKWPGVKRQLMRPGYYTELFFLDEATALAAGHRPCGECRPEALAAFKRAWSIARGLNYVPAVGEIDAVLREEARRQKLVSVDDLPAGTIIEVEDHAILRWNGQWFRWTHEWYVPCAQPAFGISLTSLPMRAAVSAGYRPIVHPSASR